MKQLFTNLTTQPHKLFFFGGTANAIITMLMLLLHYQGLLYAKVPLSVFHAYSLIFTLFTQFFAGFLLTMFPRFLATAAITRESYLKPFLLLNLSAALFVITAYAVPSLIAVTAAGLFIAYLMIGQVLWRCYQQSSVTARFDVNWILMALAAGAISHLFFLWSFIDPTQTVAREAAIQSGFFLYLFMLILTLSQKMIPLFTEGKVAGYKANRSYYFLHTVAGLLLIKVIMITLSINSYGLVDALLFIATLNELIKWRLPLRKVAAILWVLYLSLLWIPIGFLLYAIEGISPLFLSQSQLIFEKAPIHALAVGYFTTILIGFSTRIILGHAGQKPAADQYAITLFCLIQFIAATRIIAGLSLNSALPLYLEAITLSALLWLLLFMFWSKRYIKLLFNK